MDIINLLKRANNNEAKALNQLHNYYDQDPSTFTSTPELLDYCKTTSETNSYSKYHLGILHYYNIDTAIGLTLIKESAKMNCSQAMYFIVVNNISETPDITKILEQLQSAIELYNSNAMALAGQIYEGIDITKAINFYEKAASLNHNASYYYMALLYHDGEHVKQDIQKAIQYYTHGVNNMYTHSCMNLAVIYHTGEGDVQPDLDKAITLFEKAHSLNNIRATVNLADIYDRQGLADKAIKYYDIAIKQNDPLACYNMALIHQNNGTDDELKKAAKLLIKAAKQGHYKSIMKLNKASLSATSTSKDIDQMIKFKHMFKNFGAYDGW